MGEGFTMIASRPTDALPHIVADCPFADIPPELVFTDNSKQSLSLVLNIPPKNHLIIPMILFSIRAAISEQMRWGLVKDTEAD